ncbi:cyclic nucleotide-binding domain-containing protein [Magnetospirillum molischianum]|uniref:Putative two-component response transcriptional regulator, cNMP_binding domain n=1 Tax=Magnetospirillum molischianum DSM 120 TaxID=1150626 RepID=H8FSE7_MAGML|nr:cyclic nucleotide-binding domain-containing protein [Magnetospirillum molischianum]CCG41285.1 Putative two-component response transcriptional regulator, cNMP_binding domain [Magnetospirillum molischianum DSM 120]
MDIDIDIDLGQITALVIDDNRYARSFIKTALNSFGLRTILEAEDGPTGLDLLGRETVHFVIVAQDLSPMNGIDFTRQLRSGDIVSCIDIAVIMISTESSREMVVEARNSGVTEFLVKPLSTESLFRRVRNVLVNPRAFVQSQDFTGPDRRSLTLPPPDQIERRVAPPLPRPVPLVQPAGGPIRLVSSPSSEPRRAQPTVDSKGRRRFVPGEMIFAEGEPGDVAYVVESGVVSIFKQVEEHEVELGRIRTNGVFGEMALIDGEPRMAAARAVEDTVCLVIPMAALRTQLGKTPELVILVMETLLHDIRRMGRELGQIRAILERKRAEETVSPARNDPS